MTNKKPSIPEGRGLCVVQPGFEPGLTEPKSGVLPLHHWTISQKHLTPTGITINRLQSLLLSLTLDLRMQRYDFFLKWQKNNYNYLSTEEKSLIKPIV